MFKQGPVGVLAQEEYIAEDPIYPVSDPLYIADEPYYPSQYIPDDPIYPSEPTQYIASDPIYPVSIPSYSEGPGCSGTHAVWGKWNGWQLIEIEADYGETGECGYSQTYSQQPTYSEQPTYSQPSQSGSWQFMYPECDWNSKQVYDVYQQTATGEYERRNPHYQEDACGYNKTWEGPGCDGNRSVWGVWDSANRNRLISVERDYGVVPGECNNVVSTPTPYPTASTYITAERQECDGKRLVLKRFWSDNRTPQIIADYGENTGYCGVQQYYAPTHTYYQAPQTVYTAPQQTYVAPVSEPGYYSQVSSLPQIQAACSSNTDYITRGQSVTYTAYVSTGGSGRLGRADFRGEQNQSGSAPTFTVRYNTSGTKTMTVNVFDADSRGGSQFVECPRITVIDPVVTQTPGQPIYYGTPQQPYYYNPIPQPNVQPTVVYTNNPVQTTQNVDYCGAGYTQQISGGFVYCIAQNPSVITTTQVGTNNPNSCPSGYTMQTSGSIVYCIAQPGVQTTTSSVVQTQTTPTTSASPIVQTPQVVYKTADAIDELPKTGLPLAAWGVSALLPLGVKLKKGKKENSEVSANSIWTTRELDKENN